MTRNDTPDKLEWSIRPRSGTDSAQWDWGINSVKTYLPESHFSKPGISRHLSSLEMRIVPTMMEKKIRRKHENMPRITLKKKRKKLIAWYNRL